MCDLAKQLPSLSARPKFPGGLKVLLVAPKGNQKDVLGHLRSLHYDVTTASSCSEAWEKLADKAEDTFDVVLAEANYLEEGSPENGDSIMSAASSLPILLMTEPGSPHAVTLKGIRLGADDVIEKPVNLQRLQNIWQHVVRRMLLKAGAPSKLPLKCEEASELSLKESFPTKISVVSKEPSAQKGSAPTTPRTPSRAASLATQSESLDAKSSSPDTSVSVGGMDNLKMDSSSDNMTCDSSSSGVSKSSRSPLKSLMRACRPKAKEFTAASGATATSAKCPPLAIKPTIRRTPASGPILAIPSTRSQWPGLLQVNPQEGCVWGTPVPGCMPQPGGPRAMLAGVPPLPIEPYSGKASNLPQGKTADPSLLQPDLWQYNTGAVHFSNEVLKRSDESVPDGIAFDQPPVVPPIGLKLRKSESLLDLINRHLSSCAPSNMCMP